MICEYYTENDNGPDNGLWFIVEDLIVWFGNLEPNKIESQGRLKNSNGTSIWY